MKKIIKNCAIIFALVSLTACEQGDGEIVGGTINSNDFTHMTTFEWLAQDELTENVAAIFEKAGLTEQVNLEGATILAPTQYAINRFVRRHNSINHQREWQKLYPEAETWTIDMMTEEELNMMKMYIFPDVKVDRAYLEENKDGIVLKSLPFQKTVNKPNPAYNPDDKTSEEPQYLYTEEYAKYVAEQKVYDDLKNRFDLWAAYDKALELWNEWNSMTSAEQKEYLEENEKAPTEPKKPTVKEGDVEVEVVRPTQNEDQIEALKPKKPEVMYQTMVITTQQEVRLTLDEVSTNPNAAYDGDGRPGAGYQYSNFLMEKPYVIHALFKIGNNWEYTLAERTSLSFEGVECDQFYAMYYSDVQTSTGVVHTLYVPDETYLERLHAHTLLFYGSRSDDNL